MDGAGDGSSLKAEPNQNDKADFYLSLSEVILSSGSETVYNRTLPYHHELSGIYGINYGNAWRLQVLTKISELPDYERGWNYGNSTHGAPVDADDNPV